MVSGSKMWRIDGTTLQLFRALDPGGLNDFCTAAADYLLKGVNAKLYKAASSKLGVTPEDVKTAVQLIADLLIQLVQKPVNEADLYLKNLDVSEEFNSAVVQCYQRHSTDLQGIVASKGQLHPLPQYKNLEWRLDVQVASRTVHNQVVPKVLLNLTTEEDNVESTRLLQMRPDTLVHITKELEKALSELKSREYRKLTASLAK